MSYNLGFVVIILKKKCFAYAFLPIHNIGPECEQQQLNPILADYVPNLKFLYLLLNVDNFPSIGWLVRKFKCVHI